jgi:hypothetical protein
MHVAIEMKSVAILKFDIEPNRFPFKAYYVVLSLFYFLVD